MQKLQNQAELGAPVAPRRNPKIGSSRKERIAGLSGPASFLFSEVSMLPRPLDGGTVAWQHVTILFFMNSFSQINQIHKKLPQLYSI